MSTARLLSAGITALSFFGVVQPAVADCTDELVFDPSDGGFLTSDNYFGSTQAGLNCFAWQTFVGLNWPVDPSWPVDPDQAGLPDRSSDLAGWGVPPDPAAPMTTATVWQSYKPAEDIFLPDAASPSSWGAVAPAPAGCARTARAPSPARALRSPHKLGMPTGARAAATAGAPVVHSDEIMEAVGGWLTDQRGNLVFYEQLVGKSEFDYIVTKGLYDAANQRRVATNTDGTTPEGLSLPAGAFMRRKPTSPQSLEDLGAIELKAAWRVLNGAPELYDRYLTATAYLQPDGNTCTEAVVGLVGLHIIRKTLTFPDFVWATFEHVDNVPDGQGTPPPHGYAFNNPDCSGADCSPNPARIVCEDNKCRDLYPRSEPVQVTRMQPTPPSLDAINAEVQKRIAEATDGRSVFQYYKLVNVLWDGSPSLVPDPEPGANATVPLNYGSFQSEGNVAVANTTLETYVQNATCTSCHKSATIAGDKRLASDFSFVFGRASTAEKLED